MKVNAIPVSSTVGLLKSTLTQHRTPIILCFHVQ